MSIGKYSRGKLETIIKKVHQREPDPAGSDTQLQYNNGGSFGGVSSLTYNDSTGDLLMTDDKKLYFGSDDDSFIAYDATGGSAGFLVISGSTQGIVLSGSTVQIRGVLEGASPLQIAGGIEIIAARSGEPTTAMSFGDNIELAFGDDSDGYIKYASAGDYLEVSGATGGLVLSGSSVYVDSYLGIGVSGDNITHAITLPDSNTAAGAIKASSYLTYSSVRYKENIKLLESPLDIILNLRGVTYNWKKDKSPDIGFIAEEVGQLVPLAVEWDQNSEYATSMDYSRIIPILVESIKAQQKQIDSLRDEISLLKK